MSTYGGGRFLYTEPPAEGGRVMLDFNKAYNPPCVFTPHTGCPRPPAPNHLGIAIAAGEKMYPAESEVDEARSQEGRSVVGFQVKRGHT